MVFVAFGASTSPSIRRRTKCGVSLTGALGTVSTTRSTTVHFVCVDTTRPCMICQHIRAYGVFRRVMSHHRTAWHHGNCLLFTAWAACHIQSVWPTTLLCSTCESHCPYAAYSYQDIPYNSHVRLGLSGGQTAERKAQWEYTGLPREQCGYARRGPFLRRWASR